jgi:hypothetical protein
MRNSHAFSDARSLREAALELIARWINSPAQHRVKTPLSLLTSNTITRYNSCRNEVFYLYLN